jgi:hypothetical protein
MRNPDQGVGMPGLRKAPRIGALLRILRDFPAKFDAMIDNMDVYAPSSRVSDIRTGDRDLCYTAAKQNRTGANMTRHYKTAPMRLTACRRRIGTDDVTAVKSKVTCEQCKNILAGKA